MRPGFPDFRWYDSFWMAELDFQAHGQNLLWRLVTENTDIKCLQKNLLFPYDPDTNPILCSLPKQGVNVMLLASTGVEVTLALAKIHKVALIVTIAVVLGTVLLYHRLKFSEYRFLTVLRHGLVFSDAIGFYNDPSRPLLEGFRELLKTPSSIRGLHLPSFNHAILAQLEDVQMMGEDNLY